MKTSSPSASASSTSPYIKVRHSEIHGKGVFAARKIPEGTRIIEYTGTRISSKEADKRAGLDPDNPHHTFFFSLESGKIIDVWITATALINKDHQMYAIATTERTKIETSNE